MKTINSGYTGPDQQFLELLTNNQSSLYACIGTLMGGVLSAQDVLQETNRKLLERHADYDITRPFIPWALTIARYEVMTWRKKQSRDRLVLDDQLVVNMADRLVDENTVSGVELDTLKTCVKKLAPHSQRLVEERYTNGKSVQSIAERLNQSVNLVSVALFRIRKVLSECVRSTLAAEGGALS